MEYINDTEFQATCCDQNYSFDDIHRDSLEKFTNKEFGKILKCTLVEHGMRILLSESGFTIWIPKDY